MDTTEIVGSIAATITTLCWLPQAIHIIRTKEVAGVSGVTYAGFAVGIAFWLVYGLLLSSMPIIGANSVTLVLVLVILSMKLRYMPRKNQKNGTHFP